MPLIRLTASTDRDARQLPAIADAVHHAVVDALGVPNDIRFQLVTAHPRSAFSFDRGYLDVARDDVVCIEITLLAGRTERTKRDLYRRIADNAQDAGVRRDDLFVVLTENQPADWSVGNGEAQLLAGTASHGPSI